MVLKSKFDRYVELYSSLCNLFRVLSQCCKDHYILAVGFILLIGAFIRLVPLLLLGFPHEIPYNGGGLYYAFSTMIIENNFHYPIDIPYYSSWRYPLEP